MYNIPVRGRIQEKTPMIKKNAKAICLCGFTAAVALAQSGGAPKTDYPIRPVDFTKVQVTDKFWAPKMETNRTATIPFAMKLNEETGRVDNFRKAAKLMKGAFQGKRYNDSDVYKVMEGASYSLLIHPDPGLRKQLDDLVKIVAAAQEPDGYLYTTRTIDPKNPAPGAGKERWSDLRQSHELYCAGHMYEAAVAHFLATGDRSFLAVALRNADLLVRTFGPGKRRGFPGHQEVEIGLSKLYRVTGERAYLDLAKFFLDERGRYFGGEMHGPGDPFAVYNSNEYLQNHKPVLEQAEAVGHAVRAMYMYSGMADVAALGGWPEYVTAIDRLWENVTGKKMYLTGGVGSREADEGFGADYELPNACYAETCASVGNAFWNHRLFLLHGDAKYVDVLERIMYNGLISGVSLDGTRFFYVNPLDSPGGYARSPWFEVACCPPNIARFLPSVPGYLYAMTDDTLYVNLFAASTAKIDIGRSKNIEIVQETRYPWEGTVRIGINPVRVASFTLAVRIPGWARNEAVAGGLYRFLDTSEQTVKIWLNNKSVDPAVQKGYALFKRTWRKGDVLTVSFPMPIRRVVADERVKDDAGRVALQRGPVVYCAEAVDNGADVRDIVLPGDAKLQAFFRPDFLGGVEFIQGQATAEGKGPDGKAVSTKRNFLAIPYYAWANRGAGAMAVWLKRGQGN
jgi:DUF1680 family protein